MYGGYSPSGYPNAYQRGYSSYNVYGDNRSYGGYDNFGGYAGYGEPYGRQRGYSGFAGDYMNPMSYQGGYDGSYYGRFGAHPQPWLPPPAYGAFPQPPNPMDQSTMAGTRQTSDARVSVLEGDVQANLALLLETGKCQVSATASLVCLPAPPVCV